MSKVIEWVSQIYGWELYYTLLLHIQNLIRVDLRWFSFYKKWVTEIKAMSICLTIIAILPYYINKSCDVP